MPFSSSIPFMWAFLVFFVTAAVAGAGDFPPTTGVDSFLAEQSHVDREASKDNFVLLPADLKRLISVSSFSYLSDLTSYLLSLHISVPLHVHLVGPFPFSTTALLSSFLSAAVYSDRFHVMGANPHYLALNHSLQLDVDTPPFTLVSEINQAIRNHLRSALSSSHFALQSVPFSLVDTIVKEDFRKHHADGPGTHLYLLIPKPAPGSKPYAYSYSPGDLSVAYNKCLGTLYTGDDRYIWIDLAAGPVQYRGPNLAGDSVLSQEFYPLSKKGRHNSSADFVGHLASLVLSAYQVLLAPSLSFPVAFENLLIVKFIHIYESDKIDSHGLDWRFIQETLNNEVRMGGLLLAEQSLKFRKYTTRYSDCSICVSAVLDSTNSAWILTLDSKRLHQILLNSSDELRRSIGIEEEEFGRIISVYVFDLDYDGLLLLDQYHQALAFKDMVIAIRTRSSETVNDYSCNGLHVVTQTRELERPLVGSIIQSMWGVSLTHLRWSPRHNSTVVDYTWSVGQTPFGPFSETSSLSFVQKDAARRNLILASLNETIGSAIDVVESMQGFGGDRRLFNQRRQEFVQRWNFFKYKLDKSISALSHLDYEMAFFLLRSSDHDLSAIRILIYQASMDLEHSLMLFKRPQWLWVLAFIILLSLLYCLYKYVNRCGIFAKKGKQR